MHARTVTTVTRASPTTHAHTYSAPPRPRPRTCTAHMRGYPKRGL